MPIAINILTYFLPFLALSLLFFGLIKSKTRYVVLSFVIALITIASTYEIAGGELFGDYFYFTNAALYTLCFIVVVLSLLYIFAKETTQFKAIVRIPMLLIFVALIIGCFIICINVWINAFFIKDRLEDTPVIEVGYFNEVAHCANPYVYYQLTKQHKIEYLCPNYMFFIAKTGQLDVVPSEILKQLIHKNIKQPSREAEND